MPARAKPHPNILEPQCALASTLPGRRFCADLDPTMEKAWIQPNLLSATRGRFKQNDGQPERALGKERSTVNPNPVSASGSGFRAAVDEASVVPACCCAASDPNVQRGEQSCAGILEFSCIPRCTKKAAVSTEPRTLELLGLGREAGMEGVPRRREMHWWVPLRV